MLVIPFWLQTLTLIVALPLAAEGGYWLHALYARRRAKAEEPVETDWGLISGAAFSILGILLAFTVSMSVDRFNSRRLLVVNEANAISTTYLRIQLLDNASRDRMSGLMLKYARDRHLEFDAGDVRDRIQEARLTTEDNQGRLWSALSDALAQPANSQMTWPMTEAMNTMFDLAASRQASMDGRIPPRVVRIAMTFAFVVAVMTGFGAGARRSRQRLATSILLIMIAMVLGLIMDLDHPRAGAIRATETALERVTASIAVAEETRAASIGSERPSTPTTAEGAAPTVR